MWEDGKYIRYLIFVRTMHRVRVTSGKNVHFPIRARAINYSCDSFASATKKNFRFTVSAARDEHNEVNIFLVALGLLRISHFDASHRSGIHLPARPDRSLILFARAQAKHIRVFPSFILSWTLSLAVDFSACPLKAAQTKVRATPIAAL